MVGFFPKRYCTIENDYILDIEIVKIVKYVDSRHCSFEFNRLKRKLQCIVKYGETINFMALLRKRL